MDETGAKVRESETQRLCQGSHPVGPFPCDLLRLISGLGVRLFLPGTFAYSSRGSRDSFLGFDGVLPLPSQTLFFVSTFQIPDEFDNGE